MLFCFCFFVVFLFLLLNFVGVLFVFFGVVCFVCLCLVLFYDVVVFGGLFFLIISSI